MRKNCVILTCKHRRYYRIRININPLSLQVCVSLFVVGLAQNPYKVSLFLIIHILVHILQEQNNFSLIKIRIHFCVLLQPIIYHNSYINDKESHTSFGVMWGNVTLWLAWKVTLICETFEASIFTSKTLPKAWAKSLPEDLSPSSKGGDPQVY